MRLIREGFLTRSVRGTPGLFALAVLVVSGCSIGDMFGGSWATGDGSSATATRVRSTPAPTNTAWRFVTATPSPAVSPTRTPTPRPTPSPTPAPDLLPLLPTLDDMPDGLEQTAEDPMMTADEAAAGFSDADRIAGQLAGLGYRGGAYREFMRPDPGISDFVTKMLGFQATVMQFDSVEHARAAIPFQMDIARGQPDWELKDKTVATIADETTALTGTAVYEGTDVKVVALFVREGNRVYRFVSISGVYDAFDATQRIARDTLQR